MRFTRIGLFILLAGLMIGCKDRGARGARVKADLSSPRAAARSYARALESGDAATARNCVIVTDQQQTQLLDAVAGMYGAFRKLGETAFIKFGDPGRALGREGRDSISLSRKVEEADETIKGDTAILAARRDPDMARATHPDEIKLKKVGAGWKIDGVVMGDSDNYAKAIAFVQSLTQAVSDMTDEISAGKFRTVQEAKSELSRRVANVLLSGAAARPAT